MKQEIRIALIALLLFTLTATDAGAGAGAGDEICATIEWRSGGYIDCSKITTPEGKVYVLKYKSRLAFNITNASGQRSNMLKTLCDTGGLLVREINRHVIYVHHCTKDEKVGMD